MQEHMAHGEGRGEKGKTGQEPRHDLAESRVATALGRSLSHHAVVSPRLRGDGICYSPRRERESQPGDGRWMWTGASVMSIAGCVVDDSGGGGGGGGDGDGDGDMDVQVQGSVWMGVGLYEAQYGELATLAIDTGALLRLRVAVAIRVAELLGMGMGMGMGMSMGVQHDRSSGPAAAHGSGAVERCRCAVSGQWSVYV
ncbi:hypothetical protein V492_06221 [Pseudogymnoascus sp. VKM F-4246]|nr:hypothetical protein V492_06221 [Pseudogymnoascus sp. VKM F-4246]